MAKPGIPLSRMLFLITQNSSRHGILCTAGEPPVQDTGIHGLTDRRRLEPGRDTSHSHAKKRIPSGDTGGDQNGDSAPFPRFGLNVGANRHFWFEAFEWKKSQALRTRGPTLLPQGPE